MPSGLDSDVGTESEHLSGLPDARPAIGPTIVALLMVLLSGYMAYTALSFPFRPRLGPLGFSSLTFVLGLVVLMVEVRDFRRFRDPRARAARIAPSERDLPSSPTQLGVPAEKVDALAHPDPPSTGTAAARTTSREWMAFGWLAFLTICFFALGFLVGMAVFMVVMLRVYGKESWVLTLTVSGGVMTATYVLFVQVLAVQVYGGMLDVLSLLPL